MHTYQIRRDVLRVLIVATGTAWLTSCKTAPTLEGVTVEPVNASIETAPVSVDNAVVRSSAATTSRGYRKDAAAHIYGLHTHRVYQGQLPPLLYAVGVLSVEIDQKGRVTQLEWLRAPRHAPSVVAEIEQIVRQASPFPMPSRLGKVTYTETWLWNKNGQFQLDTLTEGQN